MAMTMTVTMLMQTFQGPAASPMSYPRAWKVHASYRAILDGSLLILDPISCDRLHGPCRRLSPARDAAAFEHRFRALVLLAMPSCSPPRHLWRIRLDTVVPNRFRIPP